MARFQFADGRWADLRPPGSNFFLYLDEHADDPDPDPKDRAASAKAGYAYLRNVIDHLRRATVELGGGLEDIGDLTPAEHYALMDSWIESAKEKALPKPDGGSSPSTSPPPNSPRRTAGRRKAE